MSPVIAASPMLIPLDPSPESRPLDNDRLPLAPPTPMVAPGVKVLNVVVVPPTVMTFAVSTSVLMTAEPLAVLIVPRFMVMPLLAPPGAPLIAMVPAPPVAMRTMVADPAPMATPFPPVVPATPSIVIDPDPVTSAMEELRLTP